MAPKTIEGTLYLRDFIVRDKDENIIARATSGWLAIDIRNKKSQNYSTGWQPKCLYI